MSADRWRERYDRRVGDAADAVALIRPGDTVFIGTGCAQPRHLVHALVEHGEHLKDVTIVDMLTVGDAPYAAAAQRGRFRLKTFFIAEAVRDALAMGLGEYTPIFLSDVPGEFHSGRLAIDAALISVSPPDEAGLCSLGVSVDIVRAAAANAKYVIAQVNAAMPRTLGDSFIHVDEIDLLVPRAQPLIEAPPAAIDATQRRIARNVARLVEDGSTIECGIGALPQAIAECLRDKRDLGVHTEMFGDWIIDLIERGVVTGRKKTINRGRVVASFCMGSRRLYDHVHENPVFAFHPTEYVNDPDTIARHENMVAINLALEVDLTGQVAADSIGSRLHSGVGGQVDFVRGAAASRGGKAIIALPSTAKDGAVSRIVPTLSEGAGVVTSRADAHYIVTEHGVAYLHGKSIRERALALINIADPAYRRWLVHEAKRLGFVPADQIELSWETVRYPRELERRTTMRDGSEVLLRPVQPADEPELTEMLYSLSSETVRRRFFSHTTTFPHKDVQRLTNIDYENNLAIVAAVPGPRGEEELVAIGQYFREPEDAAEVAFIVQDAWQDKGLGSRLMQVLAEAARERGIRRFTATVLPENRAMINVFRHAGYSVTADFDGETYDIRIELADVG